MSVKYKVITSAILMSLWLIVLISIESIAVEIAAFIAYLSLLFLVWSKK